MWLAPNSIFPLDNCSSFSVSDGEQGCTSVCSRKGDWECCICGNKFESYSNDIYVYWQETCGYDKQQSTIWDSHACIQLLWDKWDQSEWSQRSFQEDITQPFANNVSVGFSFLHSPSLPDSHVSVTFIIIMLMHLYDCTCTVFVFMNNLLANEAFLFSTFTEAVFNTWGHVYCSQG